MMDLGTGVAVVVVLGRIQPDQFDGIDTGGASSVQPFDARQQRRCVARRQE
jgi:hypothetical protein